MTRPAAPARLRSAGHHAAWAASQRRSLRRVLGGGTTYERIAVELALRCRAPTTVQSYNVKWSQFEAFCAREGLRALPATTATCAAYVAYLYTAGRVQPESVQPYLSAINAVHRDLFPHLDAGPAAGSIIHAVLRGWQQARAALPLGSPGARQPSRRVPLPASAARAALTAGVADAARRAAGDAELLPLAVLRGLVYLVLGFALLGRASTMASIKVDDVSLDAEHITIVLVKEKGKNHLPGGRRLQLSRAALPQLARLLEHWLARRAAAWVRAHADDQPPPRQHQLLFALPADRRADILAAASASCTAWLATACRHLGAEPPPGTCWSSHSLRSGGASAARKAGAPLEAVRHLGGWAATSNVVQHYIDPLYADDPGCGMYFNYLAPRSHPAAAPSQAVPPP